MKVAINLLNTFVFILFCIPRETLALFITGGSDGAGGESGEDEEDENGEEKPTNADEETENKMMEVVDEEFVDKKHESEFCLETNFMDKGEEEEAENAAQHGDSKGRKKKQFPFKDACFI